MKRSAGYYITPLLIADLLSLAMIVWSVVNLKRTGGWSALAVAFFFIVSLVLTAAYFIIRRITKNVMDIWIMELVVLVIIAIFLLGFIH